MADRAAAPAPGVLRRHAESVSGFRVRPGRAWALARISLDSAMLFTAAVAAAFGSSAAGLPAPSLAWTVVFGFLVVGILASRGMYGARLHHELLEDLRGVVIATSLAGMVVLSAREIGRASCRERVCLVV